MKDNVKIANELIDAAKEILAADYVYDPDHKHKPRKGGNWHRTERGWSSVSSRDTKSHSKDDARHEDGSVKCAWCGEEFPKEDMLKEEQLGYICSRCADALRSRGEELSFEEE